MLLQSLCVQNPQKNCKAETGYWNNVIDTMTRRNKRDVS